MSKQTEQPGKSRLDRGSRLHFTKGRQVEPEALAEVQSIITRVPRRDELIEALHALQDQLGSLRHRHLAALAEHMSLPLAEVFEVATFYSSFRVVDDDLEVPEVVVQVCDSWVCAQHGAEQLRESLSGSLPSNVRVQSAPCLGRCAGAPAAMVGTHVMEHATEGTVTSAVQQGDTSVKVPDYRGLDEYMAEGGYRLLRSCRNGETSFEDITQALDAAGLRGLGGAGFPTSRKWQIVRTFDQPRYVVMNADESEPGTFKDRHCFETDPHRVLEGLQIAAWAIDAERAYIYLRDEYPGCAPSCSASCSGSTRPASCRSPWSCDAAREPISAARSRR